MIVKIPEMTIWRFKRINYASFPGSSAYQVEDIDLIFGSGRSPGEGNGKPLQNSCLGNSMDIGT